MVENIKLVVFSFASSVGFGITYHVKKEHLLWAGLGGALTRCCYLILVEFIDERFVYSLLAAMVTSIYAEILAMQFKTPSTVFLYPSILPLLPGSLLYNTAVNFLISNREAMWENAANCALTLLGISIGFVITSTFTYYRRVFYLGKGFASLLRLTHKKK